MSPKHRRLRAPRGFFEALEQTIPARRYPDTICLPQRSQILVEIIEAFPRAGKTGLQLVLGLALVGFRVLPHRLGAKHSRVGQIPLASCGDLIHGACVFDA
jgi:hypothetical protein